MDSIVAKVAALEVFGDYLKVSNELPLPLFGMRKLSKTSCMTVY
jgi:hypothetical protein